MKFSIIIPVHNAAPYLETAVNSALAQQETSEVLLIEDGSSDDSACICKELSKKNPNVKWFQHPGRENRGPAASRNLGIKKALSDLIAFLDADDWYLPNRFGNAMPIFERSMDVDAVYEAVGTDFEDEVARREWYRRNDTDITTLTASVAPEFLFETLLKGKSGHIHLDGLTLRKNIAKRSDLFNTRLRFAEDTEFTIKLAHTARLYPGSVKQPVAVRRVHLGSSLHATGADKRWRYKVLCYHSLLQWGLQQRMDTIKILNLIEACMDNAGTSPVNTPQLIKGYRFLKEMLFVFLKYPPVIVRLFFWRQCLLFAKKIFHTLIPKERGIHLRNL